MANNKYDPKKIKEIAENIGYKYQKDCFTYASGKISAPYFKFLQSISRGALLLTSYEVGLSERLINLRKAERKLAQYDDISLEVKKTGKNVHLDKDASSDLGKFIGHHIWMEEEAEITFNSMLVTSIVSNFEVYIQDLVYEIFVSYPDTLRCNRALSYNEIIQHENMRKLISRMAQIEASRSTDGSVGEYLKRIGKRFGINTIKDSCAQGIIKECVETIIGIRNVIVHNCGCGLSPTLSSKWI